MAPQKLEAVSPIHTLKIFPLLILGSPYGATKAGGHQPIMMRRLIHVIRNQRYMAKGDAKCQEHHQAYWIMLALNHTKSPSDLTCIAAGCVTAASWKLSQTPNPPIHDFVKVMDTCVCVCITMRRDQEGHPVGGVNILRPCLYYAFIVLLIYILS
jgi:hypothetical protein